MFMFTLVLSKIDVNLTMLNIHFLVVITLRKDMAVDVQWPTTAPWPDRRLAQPWDLGRSTVTVWHRGGGWGKKRGAVRKG